MLEQKAGGIQGLKKRIAQVLIKDPEPMLYHAEIVLRNGKAVGDVGLEATVTHSEGL